MDALRAAVSRRYPQGPDDRQLWALPGATPTVRHRREVLETLGCGWRDVVAQVLREPGSYHELSEYRQVWQPEERQRLRESRARYQRKAREAEQELMAHAVWLREYEERTARERAEEEARRRFPHRWQLVRLAAGVESPRLWMWQCGSCRLELTTITPYIREWQLHGCRTGYQVSTSLEG